MSFDPTHLVSQLTALNREDGDLRLICDGVVVKAHSFILSLRSRYFATALATGVGNAKSKSELEVKDCSPEVLTCVVDFMYGIPIPEDFEDTKGLLHQADLFLMEDLKSAVGFLIAKTLSLNTLKDLIPLGEKYREVVLQESCSDFILEHIEEIEDSVLSELDLSLIAKKSLQAIKDTKRDSEEKIAMAERNANEKIAEVEANCARDIQNAKEDFNRQMTHMSDIGTKVLGTFKTDQFKKRADFPSSPFGEDEYEAYVKGHIKVNMLVKCCRMFYGMNLAEMVKEGDIGRIVSVEMSGVEVKWLNAPKTIMERTDCFGWLELLTNPLNTTFLA